jgi:hypothetical protein
VQLSLSRRGERSPALFWSATSSDDALVGIISVGDIVKHHVAEVVMEATVMREYIMHS